MIPIKRKLKNNHRRESIVQTAIDLMARKSIESTSMNDIAVADGISKTLLYRFFRNKYQILCAIFETRFKIALQSAQELLETIEVMIPDLEVTLPLMWKLLKKKIGEHQSLLYLFFRERVSIPHHIQNMTEACNLPRNYISNLLSSLGDLKIIEILNDYFRKCQDSGNLRKDLKPAECTRLFLSLIWIPINLFPIEDANDNFNPEKELESLVNIQIKVLLHGMLP